MASRKDHATDTERFFRSLDEPVASIARELRGLVRKAEPALTEEFKWGMPVYENERLVCAIRPGKGYMALQFYTSGTSLRDPDGLLEGTGKRMRHVKIRSRKDIRTRLFASWIRQAARMS